jgi:hypothetical protein
MSTARQVLCARCVPFELKHGERGKDGQSISAAVRTTQTTESAAPAAKAQSAPTPVSPVSPVSSPSVLSGNSLSSSAPNMAGPAISLGSNASASNPLGSSGGSPLQPEVRAPLERSFGTNLQSVRVHTDTGANTVAHSLSTRAVTYGSDIYLGSGQRPTDMRVMAHEAAHVVQQRGAPAMQLFSPGSDDAHEHEAEQASAAVMRGESCSVQQQTAPRPQGLFGISLPNPLDWLANKANVIPGFRMFTIILGVNPINMSSVPRTAANILRALIEFLPGGGLITQALENSGVFEKAGAFVEKQIASLGMTGSAIKTAVTSFISRLSLRRIITDPGGVWSDAKRIFTEPIDRIISFGKGLVSGIIQLVKDAILKPIAKLAEGTEGYNLLKGILGKDPITGEAVPRSAETLLGPLLRMIGLGDVWAKMQQANAIPRAWAWFQSTMGQLLAIVSAIPPAFIGALRSLTLEDIILIPKAFIKLGKVFVGFMGKFVSWGVNAMWKLLEIVFDVVSPGAWGYIQRTGAALKSILKNPLPFVGNLVKAAKLGFQNFGARFLTHLKRGLLDWLVGNLPGVYIPRALTLLEFGKLALSVFGVSWAQIRGKIVLALGPNGELIMKGLETVFDVVKALITGGPAAAWEVIKDKLTSLKDTIVDGVIDFIKEAVVTKAIPKLIAMFIPGAGFISAIISIYDIVKTFIAKISQIMAVVNSFISSIVAIAAGNIGAAATRVESILGSLLSLAISFFAGLVGLGNAAAKVREVINKVRTAVDKAIETAITFLINKAKSLFKSLFGKNAKDGDPEKEKMVQAGLAAIDTADQAAMKDGALTKEAAENVARTVKQQHPVFKSLTVIETKYSIDYDYVASPGKKKTGGPKGAVGPIGIKRSQLSFTAPTKAFLLGKFKSLFPAGTLGQWKKAKLDIRHKVSISDMIKHLDSGIKDLSVADAYKTLEGLKSKPLTKDKPGIIAACREHLQKANNDLGNLFVDAAGTNRRIKQRYDPGDAPGASSTAAKHDPQKSKFIADYGVEGTDFEITIDLTEDGVKTETWTIKP